MSLLRLGFPTFVMCSNETHAAVRQRLETAGLEVDTVIEDVGEHIVETEEHARVKRRVNVQRMNWEEYQRCVTSHIISWLHHSRWCITEHTDNLTLIVLVMDM